MLSSGVTLFSHAGEANVTEDGSGQSLYEVSISSQGCSMLGYIITSPMWQQGKRKKKGCNAKSSFRNKFRDFFLGTTYFFFFFVFCSPD